MTDPAPSRLGSHAAMEAAVLAVARRQLGEVGASALSLRAIAREVGVVPSALYRYFPHREAILTALITTSYQQLGAAVEEAEGREDRTDYLGRWCATWDAARAWAVAHPHEYALLYGTPVAGYQAPEDTIRPALRVVATLVRVVSEATAEGAIPDSSGQGAAAGELDPKVLRDVQTINDNSREFGVAGPEPMAPSQVLSLIDAWTLLFGAISFELFGHYRHSIEHPVEHLRRLAVHSASRLGIH